jgi:hypothetical protein
MSGRRGAQLLPRPPSLRTRYDHRMNPIQAAATLPPAQIIAVHHADFTVHFVAFVLLNHWSVIAQLRRRFGIYAAAEKSNA